MRRLRTRSIGLLVASGAVIALAGCSSSAESGAPESSPSASPSPTLNCAVARMAMDDYSVSLQSLAESLEAGDAMSAIGAADAMSFALDQLEGALPGIPAPGDAFLDASRAVALQVKQSAADSPGMEGLLGELTQSFADPAFAEGGEAIDAYADEVCPEATPSSS